MKTPITHWLLVKCSWVIIIMMLAPAAQSQNNPSDTLSKKTVVQDLCWSPDDRYVYFSAMWVKSDYSDYSSQLWTIYRFDTQNQETAIIAKSALNVAVSPDGKQLAMAMSEGEERRIYLSDTSGNFAKLLIEKGTKSFAPAWSADGGKIAFNSELNGAVEIFIWDKRDSTITQLTHSQGHSAYNPAWSPDGAHLAYYLEKGDGMDQIHQINSDGSEDRNITNDAFNNIYPRWIDANTIIYGQTYKSDDPKLFQVKSNGQEKKQVHGIESFYGQFSHDGAKIAFVHKHQSSIIIETGNGKILHEILVDNFNK